MECVDLRGAAVRHNLFDRFQPFFDSLDPSAFMCGAISRLLGDQATHFFFVLKPAPEADPKHREERNPKDRLQQKRFLEGDDVDDAVIHVILLTCTACRNSGRCMALSWSILER